MTQPATVAAPVAVRSRSGNEVGLTSVKEAPTVDRQQTGDARIEALARELADAYREHCAQEERAVLRDRIEALTVRRGTCTERWGTWVRRYKET